ncbi:uncharacterized protein LOC135479702 [Liolophura sinensis]|uniref:uncharacterized protein LOC135479702 n=1 Tax=Liolophura sinensis TaxID=3198878 RepID=UPI003158A14E
MLSVAVLCVLVAGCFSFTSEHAKLVAMFHDMDINHNGLLTLHDIGAFLQHLGHDPHSDIEKEEFMKSWMQKYGDTGVQANVIFNFFDTSGNGMLSVDDYVELFNKFDGNGDASKRDKLVTFVEFEVVMKKVYVNIG